MMISWSVVQLAQSKKRVDALFARLADADQNARGEWHASFAGCADAREPRARMLVGRAVVGAAGFAQPLGDGFQHQPLGHGDRAQGSHVGRRQMAWIEMRQQSRLLVHRARGLREIRKGRRMSETSELIGGRSVAQLRLIAEREQGFLASRRLTRPRDGKRFIEREIGTLILARRTGKRAVVAHVAAELGQRNKDLARIRDDGAVGGVAPSGSRAQQRVELTVHKR